MWLLDIFPWDKHGGQVVMRKRRASVLDIGGEWRVDLDRVAVARRPVLVRSIRLSFLAHSGYSASWLQRLTSTDARRSGFDTGTSRPQRRRGEGRSADAPSPSALSRPAGMKRLSGDGDGLLFGQGQTTDALAAMGARIQRMDAQIQRITPAARAVPPKKLGR